MTEEQFAEVMIYLGNMTQVAVPKGRILGYFEIFHHYDAKELWTAAKTYCRTASPLYFPAPANLLKLLPVSQARLTAPEAWEYVVTRLGNKDKEPDWPHPLIGECVRGVGGWYHLNIDPERYRHILRKQFIELYEEKQERYERKEPERIEGVARKSLAINDKQQTRGAR